MGENREAREAFVTLATNDTYALGCLVLGNSLRRVGTTRQLVVMVSEGVSESMRQQLAGLFNQTISVNVLDSSDTCNLELLGRPDLSVTFTKFHCWRLTQFQKCVFLDADTLVIRNIDDLFDREELSAAPDAGWPDCFNSGVFVYVPSDETYRNLLALAVTSGSFDGGDQGLLNLFFKSWATEDIKKHLPFTYNVVSQAFYSYLPAFKQFYDDIKVVHFIGAVKPWHHSYNSASRTVTPLPNTGHSQEFLQFWWDIFMDKVQQSLDPQLNPSIQQKHTFPYPSTQQQTPPPAHDRSTPPYPEPDHWSPPADHHGHSNTTGSPTTSYNILYPYVPPNVDDSSESQSFSSQDTPSSTVVDVPIVYREYKPLESHYPEEPLSSVNPEMPPSEHYSATDQLTPQGKAHTDGDTANHNPQSGDQLCSEAVSDGSSIAEGAGEQLDPKQGRVGVTVFNPDINLDPGNDITETDDGESEDSTSKGGIVGDLANITLQSAEGSTKKDDRERKLQWEQGQADYMGVDRFDNIKARLDEKISQPNSKTSLVSEEKKEESK